ncbi:hypothetical protein BHE75_01514 [Sphingomonas haloaromaticamans]|uniref:Uncharacterized protein n=1 Tax=Edaphosphingomonas haloaromaticamans TaxID=653954 RepID=A0A1S1HBL7_9SPHN|nr:hypothetical protein BHE75_01514 [Sphingomonas haloaromaticamans]
MRTANALFIDVGVTTEFDRAKDIGLSGGIPPAKACLAS